MSKVHLLTYANGEPFESSQNNIIRTIAKCTNLELVIWKYKLNDIIQKPWYKYIEYLSAEQNIPSKGRRDGSYNAWKPWLVEEVYSKLDEGDVLYYVDSSQHHLDGFLYNIDNLIEVAKHYKQIAGSCHPAENNITNSVCHNIDVWKFILKNECREYLQKPHILNTWFLFTKNQINDLFIKDWSFYSKQFLNNVPLISYHHTVDQSIFNILCYKYNLNVFSYGGYRHLDNKNFNSVSKLINKEQNFSKYFTSILQLNDLYI